MKLKLITSPLIKAMLALTACASLNAVAGTAVVKSKAVGPEEKAYFTGTLEAGWDSRYYFRGLWFADQEVWTGLSISVPINEKLSLGFGALYSSTANTRVNSALLDEPLDYSEIDLAASVTYDAKFAKFSLVYTSYQFLDGFSGTTNPTGRFGAGEYNVLYTHELGLVATAPIGPVNVSAGWYYDFNIGGSYFEVGADYPIKVNKWLSLVPSVKAGYGLDYYSNGAPENGALFGGVTSGFTHLLTSLSAPITITKTATLTPYVSWNISGRARQSNNTTDNEVFGGVKLGVSF